LPAVAPVRAKSRLFRQTKDETHVPARKEETAMSIRRTKCLLHLFLFLVLPFAATGRENPDASRLLLPEDLNWLSSPALHGLQTSVLIGNPAEKGAYVQRIKLPPHVRLEPHWHPNRSRMVTVLQGTFSYAYGETFDASKLKVLPPGSFFTEPAGIAHYAMTGNDEVVLELHATGPDGTVYLQKP
jgi:quercetin dioxygenase-like cupin family protein